MRFRLRTLSLVVLSIGPLLLAGRELARMLTMYRAFEKATTEVDQWRLELDKAYALPINRRNVAGFATRRSFICGRRNRLERSWFCTGYRSRRSRELGLSRFCTFHPF
jgi:hypothetical protein